MRSILTGIVFLLLSCSGAPIIKSSYRPFSVKIAVDGFIYREAVSSYIEEANRRAGCRAFVISNDGSDQDLIVMAANPSLPYPGIFRKNNYIYVRIYGSKGYRSIFAAVGDRLAGYFVSDGFVASGPKHFLNSINIELIRKRICH